MRRSAHVAAPILASAAALLLAGCGPEMQRCVDENNHVVDPAYCKTIPQGTSQTTVGPSGGYHVYRYYYGGGGSYSPGSGVYGGSFYPASGRSYSTTGGHSSFSVSSGTSRGGFGSSFSSGGHGSVGS